MTEAFKFEKIEEAEKEEEIEIVVEFGDESDYIKGCENCIGNNDTQTCTELVMVND